MTLIKRSYIALLLIIIALNASLESMPKDVVVSTGFNPLSASPRNPGPYGTSGLLALLESSGFKVVVVSSLTDLPYAVSPDEEIILSIIAPDRLQPEEEEILKSLAANKRVSILLATENTEGFSTELAGLLTSIKCGVTIAPLSRDSVIYKIVYNATARAALIMGLPGGEKEVLVTGYLAPLARGVAAARHGSYWMVTASVTPPFSVRAPPSTDIYAIAVALPPAGEPIMRFVAGVACDGPRGRLVLLGDSSIFVNELVESEYKEYTRAALSIYRYLAGGRSATVVFVADIYATNGSSFLLKFHPSMLLTELALKYRSMEEMLITSRAAHPYLAIIAIVLGIIAYAAMPRHLWIRAPRSLERLPRPKEPPRFLGMDVDKVETAGIVELCALADRLLRSSLGLSLPDLRGDPGLASAIRDPEVREAVRELVVACPAEPPKGSLRLLRRILGLEERDRERIAALVEVLWRRLGTGGLGVD